jgi:flagellar motor switch protein FliM
LSDSTQAILSKSEIDELLSAVAESKPAPAASSAPARRGKARPVAKPYDFRTANKFSNEQRRTFNIIFQSYCQLFAGALSTMLRAVCDCDVQSVREMQFSEFINTRKAPVLLGVFAAPPIQGQMIIDVSREVAYIIISRMLGGVAAGLDHARSTYSEIEQNLVGRTLRSSLYAFDEAWEKVLKTTAKFDRLEVSPQFAQIVEPIEPIIEIGLSVKIGEDVGTLTFCIPHSAISGITQQINAKLWYASSQEKRAPVTRSKEIGQKLSMVPIDIIAYFNPTSASVAEVLELRVGDIIRLNHLQSEPVTVNLQHLAKFRAKIGVQQSQRAIQITEILQAEDILKGDKSK